MSAIIDIHALEVLDSRGNPTVQVQVFTEDGGYGKALVASGASTGSLEALELRDKTGKYAKNWYGAKGVQTAVDNIGKLSKYIIGMEVTHQRAIDKVLIELDGTKNKSKYGANAILGISMAVLRAAANELDIPLFNYIGGANAATLPVPMLNVINGGDHAPNTLDIQEFMIVPVGAKTFKGAMQMANKVFHNLAKLLKENGFSTSVGDEGGFAPNLRSHEEALEYIVKAIKVAGFKAARKGKDAIAIAIDAAASEFYKGKKYVFKKLKHAIDSKLPGFTSAKVKNSKVEFTTKQIIEYYEALVKKYPIISIEDGVSEKDWSGFETMTKKIGDKVQIVGDDLTVTNPAILEKAIEKNAINSILIKLNQIGTVTETLDTIELAHKAGYTAVISHRSGETEDTTIADLAVGMNTGQIKTGSISRTDRIAKYNRLLNIENQLDFTAKFLGHKVFNIK